MISIHHGACVCVREARRARCKQHNPQPSSFYHPSCSRAAPATGTYYYYYYYYFYYYAIYIRKLFIITTPSVDDAFPRARLKRTVTAVVTPVLPPPPPNNMIIVTRTVLREFKRAGVN